MKKTLLILTFALFATGFIKAQTGDISLGDFEDPSDTIEWILYGETYEIVNNPLVAEPNTSPKVVQNVTVDQYQGMSMHDLTYMIDSFTMFSFDVYDATGAVDFIVNVHGATSDGTDVTSSYYSTTIAGEWLHYEVDLTVAEEFETFDTITQLDLQNNTAVTELYWDNMLLTAKYLPSAIDVTKVKTNELLFFPNPASSSELIRFTGDIEDNSVVEVYNVAGQLKLTTYLNNGLLNISSLNSGLYLVKVGNRVAKLMIR